MIFNGGVATDLYAISEEFVRRLPIELGDPNASDRLWTEKVTALLFAMGKEREFMVCCHGSPDQGEWLLDTTWLIRDQHKIVLAVESEWGKLAPIEDDFDKLLSIKAPRKLMLFNTSNHKGANEIVEKLASNMLAFPYHLVGEEYMLMEVTAPGAFRYYFKLEKDGPQNDVTFESAGPPLQWPWQTEMSGAAHP